MVHRTPNVTFSWVHGGPVERLTVVRVLPEAAAVPLNRAASGQSSSVLRSRSTVPSSTPIPAT